KLKTEPEQLELFGWDDLLLPMGKHVCEQIADVACRSYHISADSLVFVHNMIARNCAGSLSSGHGWANSFSLYTNGMAMALNPLPMSTVQGLSSWRSDRIALSSDWEAV